MPKTYDMHELTKSVLWEEAKGKLRAMVAADGALHGNRHTPTQWNGSDQPFRFQVVSEVFEAFIRDVEENEYHI